MEESQLPGSDSENPIERLLASLATPAEKSSDFAVESESSADVRGEAKSVSDIFYGSDEPTAEDLAQRLRWCVIWSNSLRQRGHAILVSTALR